MPIDVKPDTAPVLARVGVARRLWTARWVLLVLVPIPLTLLGVALATVGGWPGIGLVVALQGIMVAALILTADHPLPGPHGASPAAVETLPVDDVGAADAGQSSDDPDAR